MVVCGAISGDHAERHCLFFHILTNFHSVLSGHIARDGNLGLQQLLWHVNKNQMSVKTPLCKYFLSALKNSAGTEEWS